MKPSQGIILAGLKRVRQIGLFITLGTVGTYKIL